MLEAAEACWVPVVRNGLSIEEPAQPYALPPDRPSWAVSDLPLRQFDRTRREPQLVSTRQSSGRGQFPLWL